ncbi:MAG: type II secretion system F family protein [Planctomycetota bacterium]|nr:type II secretion system F family protein [Planctomycetota bacterium]
MADPFDHSVTEALRAWRMQHGAGIDTVQTLLMCAPICRSSRARACFEAASQRISGGDGIEGALQALSPVLSEAERFVIAAGWSGGRVEAALDAVVAQRELWLQTRSKIRSGMVLPVLVLLVASFVAPLPGFLVGEGSIQGYLFSALLPLAIAGVAWKVFSALLTSRPPGLDSLLLTVPLARQYEKQRSLSEFSSLLSLLLNAGVPIIQALQLCGRAVRNSLYREEIARCAAIVEKGQPLSSALKPGRFWPPEYVAAVATGEKAGSLDAMLGRLGDQARERYTAAVMVFSLLLPKLIYGMVGLFVIWQIFQLVSRLAGVYNSVLPP